MPTNDIKSLLNLKGEKVENIFEINSNSLLGKAYFLQSAKSEQNINENNENNDNHIKILLCIYMDYKYIDYKISKKLTQDEFKSYYIVNKNYINKLKDIFKYKDFCTLNIKEKLDAKSFNELLNNKAHYEEIKKESSQIKFNEFEKQKFNEIKNDENLTHIKKEYLKDNNELYYYNNFEIISNDLYQILDKFNISLKNEKIIIIKCLFGENKIIFYPNESNVNHLIISSMNFNYEFICDFIFYYNNSDYLKTSIKEI